MNQKSENWVAIVYSEGDKVASRLFSKKTEDEARDQAGEWVRSKWGENADWSLHHLV
tara:strand:- start:912 stop:1082 length:171 start_codon:yes stop_codon:yes gene_type:complete